MKRISIISFCLVAVVSAAAQGDPRITEVWDPVPPVITPGQTSSGAPSDAIILFCSKGDTAHWTGRGGKAFAWNLADSFMTAAKAGDIQTRQSFGDCQLHIEWRTPAVVKGDGQGRGNSGIFFMGHYELQVLDSYRNTTYSNGQAGSIYKQRLPLVNACRPPGEWQSYDVIFTAPRFYENGSVQSAARITVFQNGVLIQNNVEIWGSTQYIGVAKYEKHGSKEPLVLQDHGDPVSYRNIWIREL